jgi:AcrR family transcriptional regulator
MSDSSSVEDARGRLLAGLARALETAPLPSITIATIVREGRASKSTFYQFFQNKEECFLALYAENSARIMQVLQLAAMDTSKPLEDRIRVGTQAYLSAMQAQAPLMQRLYIDILGLSAQGARVRRQVNQQFADLLIRLYNDSAPTGGALPAVNAQAVLAVIAGLNELILYKIDGGEADDLLGLADTTDELVNALMVATLARQGAPQTRARRHRGT